MTQALTPTTGILPPALAAIGRAANEAAARNAFADYQQRKAENTLRRQRAGLTLFAEYLIRAEKDNLTDEGTEALKKAAAERGLALATDPDAWKGITWGLAAGFQAWQIKRGYAVSSVNVRLSTIKRYARLALKAGTLAAGIEDANPATEYALIQAIEGYSRKAANNLDERRQEAGIPTRSGHKKAEPKALTPDQVELLKQQPGTPQGRRDRLLICLLFDHGLRVGEIAGLVVTDFDLKAGELHFYRQKVDKVQTHQLTVDALQAARAYMERDALATGPLMRGSRKDGRLHDAGMTTRSLTARVRALGAALGIEGLSAHDGRHTWATLAARSGTPIDRLQDAGGWASPAMPLLYVEAAKIANQGVKLE